jgi:hypothetical protein
VDLKEAVKASLSRLSRDLSRKRDLDRKACPGTQGEAGLPGARRGKEAATTIAGIELMHRIRKGQFKLGRLGTKGNTAPKIWNAVLAA